ncbi:alpha/beta fold hydrolase [Acuticoccus sediminis]|uniref:alpha/beta fold hydrolase n=1 Tax=Acuticoccus sediminis TaxID=2184697 RepID=UPI001CFED4CF|nr:alpha/beta fold hydrolase [Acuticoccus sediminis]
MSHSPPTDPSVLTTLRTAQLTAMDQWRAMQARTLDAFGFGARECAYRIVSTHPTWRLRHYAGPTGGTPLLMVPAPIKRPYIWDLSPSVSAIRFCLARQFDVYLIEWQAPGAGDGGAGIEAYARSIATAAEGIAAMHGGAAPLVLGHSLGGTLSGIACALRPEIARGLVLLGAPLSFTPGSSPFRDVVVANGHGISQELPVPGAQLSQSCALLSPGTFVWPRWMDGVFSLADPVAFDTHVRVERWALDEVPLPGKLVHQIVDWLYRKNQFLEGQLELDGRTLGPEDLQVPVLAVVNDVDEIGPRLSVEPFFARMTGVETDILEHPAEVGVGLQHLAILVGQKAHAQSWPKIADWIIHHAGRGPVADTEKGRAPARSSKGARAPRRSSSRRRTAG